MRLAEVTGTILRPQRSGLQIVKMVCINLAPRASQIPTD
jgi:hypothetical protein